jgi:hypothetical protein
MEKGKTLSSLLLIHYAIVDNKIKIIIYMRIDLIKKVVDFYFLLIYTVFIKLTLLCET